MAKGAIQAGNTNLTTRDIVFTSSAELTVLLSITLPGPVLDEKYIPYFDCVMVFPLIVCVPLELQKVVRQSGQMFTTKLTQ